MARPVKPPRLSRNEWLLSTPTLVWLGLLFLIPTLIVLAVSFKPVDAYGSIGPGWTLDTLLGLGHPNYPAIVLRTMRLSLWTTGICLLIALPVGYAIARSAERWKHLLLLLVIIPFWTNFLIRIFAWKMVLHPEGWLKQGLAALGVLAPEASLLYRESAVLVVLVYTYLPFAILPIYAAAEKFDPTLLEAARDLGCGALASFFRIFVPGISRGLLTAALVVMIPALGSYVIPDLVGGPSGEMIGNKMAQRVFTDRHLPHAAALASLLTLAVVLPMLAILVLQRRRLDATLKTGGAP